MATTYTGDELLTAAEVSVLLHRPTETLRYWRKKGVGPKGFRLPGTRNVLYAREDVEAYIAALRAGANAAQ